MWLDLREVLPGVDDPAALIRERTGVYVSSGPAFGSVGAGCVRINIGTSWEILDTLLDAIVATVRGS